MPEKPAVQVATVLTRAAGRMISLSPFSAARSNRAQVSDLKWPGAPWSDLVDLYPQAAASDPCLVLPMLPGSRARQRPAQPSQDPRPEEKGRPRTLALRVAALRLAES